MESKDWLINKQNGVFYLTPPASKFEAAYTTVRSKEERLLTDEMVKLLPESSLHAFEWEKRKWTLDRFEKCMSQKPVQRILEIGCGNGWFTNRLLRFADDVVGLDVGQYELEQAARCFKNEHLSFVCCGDWSKLPTEHFDLVVFNGSIQYFDINAAFWEDVLRLLKSGGEVHLLDSPIYDAGEDISAKQRSTSYFTDMNVPEASEYYYHLVWDQIPANAEKKYVPNKWLNKLSSKRSPFPWVVIHKPA